MAEEYVKGVGVVDIDMGYKRMIESLLGAEGTVAEVGVLSGAPRYPKKRGGSAVAKVAGVLQAAHGWLSYTIDTNMVAYDRAFERARDRLIAGESPMVVMDMIAQQVRDDMRKEIQEKHFKKGVLWRTIRYRVKSPAAFAAERAAYKQFLSAKAKAQKRIGGRFAR